MKLRLTFSVILLVSVSSVNVAFTNSLPKSIKIVTANPIPVIHKNEVSPSSIDIEIFDLSLNSKVEKMLSHSLSDDPEKARQQSLKRIDVNFEQIKKFLHLATEAQILVGLHGITQLPAAIVDDSMIIYGTTSPIEILTIWKSIKNSD